MIDKFPVTIPQLSGKKKRNAYVYVPDYATKDMSFPVLYMFDGHNVFFDEDAAFGKSWGMKEYLEETAMPLMVVAVECNHGKNYARLKEYSPFTFQDEKLGRITGKGEKYMSWLVDEFKPMIDEYYPTLRDREHTFIAGSSMGGLMSLYAVTAFNRVFSRAACLSPSVWTQPQKLRRLIREADMDADTVVYLDYGSREMGNHQDMRRCFSSIVKELMDKPCHVTGRIVPNGDHCESCWEEQLPVFMPLLQYERE